MVRALFVASALAPLTALVACDRTPGEASRDAQTTATATTASAASSAPPLKSATPGGPWNAAQIDWLPYDTGMARAETLGKPVLLVVSATWCPHCKNYMHVFDDARVADRARDFVMIHIDADADAEVSSRYTKDGDDVPRTYFLAPDGASSNVPPPNGRFHFFFDEHDPSSLLGGMHSALASLK